MQLVVVMAVRKAVRAATLVMGTGTWVIAVIIPKYLSQ